MDWRSILDQSSDTSNRRSASVTERKQLWIVTVNLNYKERLNVSVYHPKRFCAFRMTKSPQCHLSL